MGLKVHLLRAFLLSFTGQGRRGRFARRGSESLAIKRDVSLIKTAYVTFAGSINRKRLPAIVIFLATGQKNWKTVYEDARNSHAESSSASTPDVSVTNFQESRNLGLVRVSRRPLLLPFAGDITERLIVAIIYFACL